MKEHRPKPLYAIWAVLTVCVVGGVWLASRPDTAYPAPYRSARMSGLERANRGVEQWRETTTTTSTTTTAPPVRVTAGSVLKRQRVAAPVTPVTAPAVETTQQPQHGSEWTLPEGCSAAGKKSRAHSLHCWGGLINQYDWPRGTAFAIMHCESQGDANARNPSSSATGLMQILRGTTDPVANMHQAYGMWRMRGFSPWVCQ